MQLNALEYPVGMGSDKMSSYYEEVNNGYILKLRKVQKELPGFLNEFFVNMSIYSSPKTRLSYAYDLKLFFHYLVNECSEFENTEIKNFTIDDLKKVKAFHILGFLDYVSFYEIDGKEGTVKRNKNEEKGKSRKLSAVRRMLKFFYMAEKIPSNPGELVETPKIHDKAIVRLEPDEVAKLLDEVESGANLTQRQQAYHEYTRTRDLALIMLLLGTGMRVSECVGIDIDDIDFSINGIKIMRKGNKESIIYFSDEVCDVLYSYLNERKEIQTQAGSENALFLSMQKKRIGVRTVQNIVKKYTQITTPLKKISPHKLRSTFGTTLYKETGDIYLVADVLGHNDVNTTKKHYAAMDDENRRKAARIIKLRSE